MSRTTTIKALTTLSAISLLTACGGGGGGGGGGTPAPATVPLTIDSSNMKAVAAAGAQVIFNSGHAGELVSSTVVGVQTTSVAHSNIDAVDLVRFALHMLENRAPAPVGQVVGTSIDATSPCDSGGTIRITGNYSDPDTYNAGDKLTFTFQNCVESGRTYNGALTLSIEQYAYTATTLTASVAATFSSLKEMDNTGGNTLNGDLHVDLTEATAYPYTVNSDARFNQLITNTLTVSGAVVSTITLQNGHIVNSWNGSTGSGTYAVTETATGTWPGISGTLFIDTPVTIQYDDPLTVIPRAGSYTVGADKGSIRVDFTTGGASNLTLNLKVDGSYELTIPLTWADLGVVAP